MQDAHTQENTPLPVSGLAVASLVLGIVSFVACGSCLTAIPGIICGHMALRNINDGYNEGRTLAKVALFLNYAALVLTAISILLFMILVGSGGGIGGG